jgi:hypothetical protein
LPESAATAEARSGVSPRRVHRAALPFDNASR